MDFSFSSDQNELRALTRQILTDACTTEHLKSVMRSENATDLALWKTLADAGLVGIGLPESVGGGGLGLTEVAIVLEEIGRVAAPVPAFA
ncbi:MAG: hypothetical protein RLZZ39_1368, partial [Actinomycetota bacterium]